MKKLWKHIKKLFTFIRKNAFQTFKTALVVTNIPYTVEIRDDGEIPLYEGVNPVKYIIGIKLNEDIVADFMFLESGEFLATRVTRVIKEEYDGNFGC